MNREDIQKLLGGYATDTLTPEEQQVLFEAALDDQELFDALAREQALRDLLRDAGAKGQLLAVLDDRPLPWYRRLFAGWRPLAAAAAMAGVTTVAVIALRHGTQAPQRVIVAQVSRTPAEARSAEQAPVARRFDAPSGAVEKESAKSQGGQQAQQGSEDDNRRAKSKEAPVRKRNGVADSLNEAYTPPRAEPGPVEAPRTSISGLREGALQQGGGGVGGYLGGAPAGNKQIVPAQKERVIAGFRDTTAEEKGAVAGAIAPGAAPMPPAAPPVVVAPKAEALSRSSPTGQQSQFGQQMQQPAQAPQFRQVPQSLAQQNVNVQPSNVPLDSASAKNAQSLFYGAATPSKDLDKSAAETNTKASALKKTEQSTDQEKTQRQGVPANGIGAAAGGFVASNAANPGVRYSLLRKAANGRFQDVDPNNLKMGDTIELEFIPNERGFLIVRGRGNDGGWRQLFSRSVERLKKYVVAPLKSGEKELLVSFRRQPVVMTGAALADEKSRANVSQSTTEPATYVVGDPAAPLVEFTITITYK